MSRISLDILSNNTGSCSARSTITTFTKIGSICGQNKYSIMEFEGLSMDIHDAAHELGLTLSGCFSIF